MWRPPYSRRLSPAPWGITSWPAAMLLAIVFYALGSLPATAGAFGPAWTHTPYYARALPIDWLTAGAGGALFGYWSSQRVHEAHHLAENEQ